MGWRCIPIATNNGKKELDINGAIRDREVRLIGADGSQLGVMSAREAQRLADEKNLDLVKIAPQAVPPVCPSCVQVGSCVGTAVGVCGSLSARCAPHTVQCTSCVQDASPSG